MIFRKTDSLHVHNYTGKGKRLRAFSSRIGSTSFAPKSTLTLGRKNIRYYPLKACRDVRELNREKDESRVGSTSLTSYMTIETQRPRHWTMRLADLKKDRNSATS
jgi:hypothetical protein